MGSEIATYLELGFDHIIDWQAYDHLLFVAALVVMYRPREWRDVLVLITAFTVGHSLTLALATLNVVRVDSAIVEVLIPITILLTALWNIRSTVGKSRRSPRRYQYPISLVFGLIHGLGFSAFLRAALGGEESILAPLLAFNIGLELGQLLVVLVVVGLGTLVVGVSRMDGRSWILVISGSAAGIAITMIIDRLVG